MNVGERDRRLPRQTNRSRIEPNDVGIHEFIGLCRELNAEPFIAVNTGLGDALSAAVEVEYVNGAVETPMRKLRAENGHPVNHSM